MMKRVAIVALVLAHTAYADSPTAKAEALFRQGRDLMAAGKLAEACATFDASQRLDPATTTLFNQADCREKAGQLATAWGLFVEAERETRGAIDAAGTRMHEVAVERSVRIEARVSKLTVKVGQPAAGLVVMRDGTAVDPGEWNHALPIDGGTYTFTAKLGERVLWTHRVTVANEGAVVIVDVVLGGDGGPAAGRAPVLTGAAHANRKMPIIATAGSAVLLGGALVFELWGDSTYDRAKASHDIDLWHAANTKRYVAEGLLAAGIGCAGVAVWLWTRHEPAIEVAPHTAVVPAAAPGYAGVALQGAW